MSLSPPHFDSPPVLVDWRDRSEDWMKGELSPYKVTEDVLIDPSSGSLDIKIRSLLSDKALNYPGKIRQLEVVKNLGGWRMRHYRFYMWKRNDVWLILDAATWDQQITG